MGLQHRPQRPALQLLLWVPQQASRHSLSELWSLRVPHLTAVSHLPAGKRHCFMSVSCLSHSSHSFSPWFCGSLHVCECLGNEANFCGLYRQRMWQGREGIIFELVG